MKVGLVFAVLLRSMKNGRSLRMPANIITVNGKEWILSDKRTGIIMDWLIYNGKERGGEMKEEICTNNEKHIFNYQIGYPKELRKKVYDCLHKGWKYPELKWRMRNAVMNIFDEFSEELSKEEYCKCPDPCMGCSVCSICDKPILSTPILPKEAVEEIEKLETSYGKLIPVESTRANGAAWNRICEIEIKFNEIIDAVNKLRKGGD